MILSKSVLRRYTPPTCTLEIVAQDSPLSRWAGQQVLKDLNFQLNLDDPRSSEETWVTLTGDRTQLEALHEAVDSYLQAFLGVTAAHLDASLLQTKGQDAGAASLTTHPVVLPVPSPATEFYPLPQGLHDDNSASVAGSAESSAPSESTWDTSSTIRSAQREGDSESDRHGIYLRPQGLVGHSLVLGSLATDATGASIRLSTLQLFDLATALDEYAADALTLPTLNRRRWFQSPPSWARIAAIAVLTIGVTTSIAKLVDSSNQQVATTGSQGASSQDQQRMNQAIPPVTSTSPSPGILTVPSPLASGQPLPPPPPPGSTNPGMPTVTVPQAAPVNPGTATSVPNNPGRPVDRSTTSIQSASRVAQRGGTQAADPAEIRLSPQIAANAPVSKAAGRVDQEASASTAADSNNTAFDTIPQVAEARRYFQQRWQPPEGLSQTLEYTLILAPNGTIERINPLGQASGDNIDRTRIPLLGEPFVSPISGGRRPTIRVVFTPDGKVQTFLQSLSP